MSDAPTDRARLEACYARGDFRAARRIAQTIAAAPESTAADKERAAQILAATGIDPVAIGVFLATAAILAFLIARYVP